MTIARAILFLSIAGWVLLAGAPHVDASASDGTGIVLVVQAAEGVSPSPPPMTPPLPSAPEPWADATPVDSTSASARMTAPTESQASATPEDERVDTGRSGWASRLPAALNEAGEAFAFPLALAAAVAAFLAIERKLDGRDPKLTRSPLNAQLGFE